MEILAVKQIRHLLDLLGEGHDLKAYLDTLPETQRNAMVFVLNLIVKEIENV